MIEFGIVVLPWQLPYMVYRVFDLPLYLAQGFEICRISHRIETLFDVDEPSGMVLEWDKRWRFLLCQEAYINQIRICQLWNFSTLWCLRQSDGTIRVCKGTRHMKDMAQGCMFSSTWRRKATWALNASWSNLHPTTAMDATRKQKASMHNIELAVSSLL